MPQDQYVKDVDWLRMAGVNGFVVFMKDEAIRINAHERAAGTRLVWWRAGAHSSVTERLASERFGLVLWDDGAAFGAAEFLFSSTGHPSGPASQRQRSFDCSQCCFALGHAGEHCIHECPEIGPVVEFGEMG